jgi:Ca-activated chloride channel family protein
VIVYGLARSLPSPACVYGAVEIHADLQERQQAESAYQEARQRGQQAALLTRESPDVFSLSVAGLKPDQDIVVETSYVQLARMEGPSWSLRLPLTTAPRYVRSDELDARHAQRQPLLLLRDPGRRFGLSQCPVWVCHPVVGSVLFEVDAKAVPILRASS